MEPIWNLLNYGFQTFLKYASDITFWKDFAPILESLAVTLGIAVGAFWGYTLFVRQRKAALKLTQDFSIVEIILPEKNRYVHAEIKLENLGNVIFKSNYAELRINKIFPVNGDIELPEKGSHDIITEDRQEVDWPMIAMRCWNWKRRKWKWYGCQGESGHGEGLLEIEPGEFDTLHADFIIDAEITTVQFYFYIQNIKKKPEDIGWVMTKIVNLKPMGGSMSDSVNTIDNGSKSINEQQRRKKQQKPKQPQKPQQPPKKEKQDKKK